MKLRSTLLFAAASLTAPALLPVAATTAAAFFAASVPAFALNSATTEYNGTTYSGDIYNITNTENAGGLGSFTAEKYDSSTGTFSGSYGGSASYSSSENSTAWLACPDGAAAGNTLLLNTATSSDLTFTTDWMNYVWLGGLITASGDYSYTFGRSNTAMKLKGSAGVNMNIGADVTLLANNGISIESSGSWVVASGKTLTLSSSGGITISADVPIEISGGGSVVMGNITLSGGSGTITYDGSTDGAVTTNNNIITSGPTSFDFISVEEGSTLTIGTVTLAAGFTGTVEVKNLTNTLNLNSARLGVAGSTLHLDNVSSTYLSNATFAANIDVGSGGFIVNQGSSGSGGAGIFSGKITGTGTITFDKWGTASQYGGYKFTGDMTGFSGNIAYNQANELSFGNGAAYASSAGVSDGVVSNITGTGSIDSAEAKVTFNYAASENYDVLAVGNSSISARTLEFTGGADYTVTSSVTGKNESAASNTLTVSAGTATFSGTVSNFGTLEITNDGKVVFSGSETSLSLSSLRIGAASEGVITFEGGLTKANTTFDDNAQATLDSILVNENGASVSVADDGYYYVGAGWTGTVELKNISSVTGLDFNNYGVAGSKIVVNGITGGYFLNANTTFAADIELVGSNEDGTGTAFSLNEGYSTRTYTFTGAITGKGDWVFNKSGVAQRYVFTGDVSGYEGNFNLTVGGSSDQPAYLQFGDGGEGTTGGSVSGTGSISLNGHEGYVSLRYNYSNDVLASNDISGNAELIKQGAGTLTLTGDLTYTGATTVSEGKLVFAAEDGEDKTVSSAITVASGAALGKTGTGTLTLGGDVTFSGGSILDLTNIAPSEDDAVFKASGTVTFGTTETTEGEGDDAVTVTTGVTIVLGGETSLLGGTYKVFDLGNTGLLEGWSELTKDNFMFRGSAITSSRVEITTNAENGTFTIEGGIYDDMTWNGGASGTWDESAKNWQSTQSGSEENIAFAAGDSVIFNTEGASVTLGSSIDVYNVTVSADTTFTASSSNTLTANSISVTAGTLTLAGGFANYTWGSMDVAEGATLDLGTASDAIATSVSGEGTVKVESTSAGHSVNVDLGSDFAGTLDFTGKFNTNSAIAQNANATIALSTSSTTGGSLWGSNTIVADVLFKTDYQIGDTTATTITLAGNVSTADGATVTVGGTSPTVTFTGTFSGNLTQDSGTVVLAGTFDGRLEQTSGTLTLSGGTEDDDKSGDFSFSYLKVSNGSSFTLGENIALTLTSADIAGEFTVQSGAVLDLTGNSRTENFNGNGKLIINGGTVKIANLGWGAGTNFGANFNYDRIQLSNGGVLEVTAAQPDGDGAGQRGFSVTGGEGTYRFTGEGMSYLVNNTSSQLISVADGATLVFDVVDANSGITVSKLIAKGTNASADNNNNSEISTGSLRKTGAGMLTLNGEGAYSGGTVIEAGVLMISNASAVGTGDVQVTDSNAVFTVMALGSSDGISLANNISGDGWLTTVGDVTLSGTLDIGNVYVGASLALESEDGKIAGTLNVGDGENTGTFTSAYDFSAGAFSGSGTVAASGDEMRTATLTGTGSDSSFSGTIKNLNVTVASGTTTATFAGTTWTGANDGDSWTGTVKVVSGAAEFTGTQTGFAGRIELAGGEIKGTLNLESGWTLTASAEAGAAKIENLTLAGGSTAEWTYLNDAVQAGAEAQSYVVSGTLNFTGTEDSVVTLKLTDPLTAMAENGTVTKFTLFEFGTLQVNGTDVSSLTSDSSTSDILAALGNGVVFIDDSGVTLTNYALGYESTENGGKLTIWRTSLSQTIYWKGNEDGDGGWTEENVWADGSTEELTTFQSQDRVELKDLDDDATRTITISGGNVLPSSVTVSGGKYVITGVEGEDYGIYGLGYVVVQSGAQLTMSLANTYTGGTTVNAGGVLNVTVTGALGTGTVALGGALNVSSGVTEIANDLTDDSAGTAGTGVLTYAGDADSTLTLSGDRSGFTGTLNITAGTVALANGTGTEIFKEIAIADGAGLRVFGAANEDGHLTETLQNVSGTGTIVFDGGNETPTDDSFAGLYLSGTFTGTVELKDVNLVAADMSTAGSSNSLTGSIFGGAEKIVLNNAALNFTNTAAEFAKDIEIAAGATGYVRSYANNSGAVLTGSISGTEGTLNVRDGGVTTFTGDIDVGAVTVESGTTTFTGTNFNVAGDVSLAGTSAEISYESAAVGGNLTATATAVNLGGKLTVSGNFDRQTVDGGDGRETAILDGAFVTVRGNASFGNNENLTLGEGAAFSVDGTLSNYWGLSVNLGAGAVLTAETFRNTFDYNLGDGRQSTFSGAGADSSVIRFGGIELSSYGVAEFDDVRVEIGASGIASGGANSGLKTSGAVFAVLAGASGWSSDAAFTLTDGETTFETASDESIALSGNVSGEGTLVKTGAGTLTLSQANANEGGIAVREGTLAYAFENAAELNVAGTVEAAGTLAFTEAVQTTLGAGTNLDFAAGGKLYLGAGSTLTLDSSAVLSGDVTLNSGGSGTGAGKLQISQDYVWAADSSLTLESGARVTIDSGRTLSIGDLRYTGTNSFLTGDGTLELSGSVTVSMSGSGYAPTLGVNTKIAAGAEVVFDTQVGTLTLGASGTGLDAGDTDSTIVKTGAGSLTFATDAIQSYDGKIRVEEGTATSNYTLCEISSLEVTGGAFSGSVEASGSAVSVTSGGTLNGNVTLSGGSFTLNGGALTGNVTLNGSTATLGGSTETSLNGNLTLAGTHVVFNGGETEISGALTWNDGNTVALSDSFRKTVTGTETVLTFGSTNLDDGIVGDFDEDETSYGRRTLSLTVVDGKEMQIVSAGALIWDDDNQPAVWTAHDEEMQWTFDGYGSTEAFIDEDYVMFKAAGSILLGDESILTSGVVFDLEGDFTLDSELENGAVLTDEGVTNGNTAGLTVASGNVVITENVRNEMTGGVFVYGGSLTVSSADALGAGTVTIGDMTSAAVTATLTFAASAEVSQQVLVGTTGAVISVAEDAAVTLTEAIGRATTADVSGEEIQAESAALTKTGAGALNILRTSVLDRLTVSEGTVTLTGAGELTVKNVTVSGSGSELGLTGDEENGANTAFTTLSLANGGRVSVSEYSFRAETISATSGTGNFVGGAGSLYIDDSATTAVSVANGAELTLANNVSGAGTLNKTGAGTLKYSGDLIASDVLHSAGTVSFTGSANVSGEYEIASGANAKVIASAVGGTFSGGIVVDENASFTMESNNGGATNIVGFSAAEGSSVSFTGNGTVTVSGDSANFGALSNTANLKNALYVGATSGSATTLNITAAEFTAGYVAIANGSTLAISAGTASAQANAIYVSSGATGTLDLTGGAELKLVSAGYAALGGTGTLEIVGGTLTVSGTAGTPSIVLNNATFNFEVEEDVVTYSRLASITTKTGTTDNKVSKSGAGTLVIADESGDVAFTGDVELKEGATHLYSTMSNADVAIESGASLRFFGTADADNPLAKSVSGTGTVEIARMLKTEDAMSSFSGFDGTISAFGNAGEIRASGTLNDWLSNGAAGTSRTLAVANGGTISALGEDVELSRVSLKAGDSNSGYLLGYEGRLTVGAVSADAGTELWLSGTGTLGTLTFAEENAENTLSVNLGADWTLTGAGTNISQVNLYASKLTVAAEGALADAAVQMDAAILEFTAGGTYGNDITFDAGAAVIASGEGTDVALTGTFSEGDGEVLALAAEKGASLTVGDSVLNLENTRVFLGYNLETDELADGKIVVNVTSDGAELRGSTDDPDYTGTVQLRGAGTAEFNVAEGKTLTVSETLGSIGEFAVTGAGTVEFDSSVNLAVARGGAGTLSVADGATVKIVRTNLSEFTLTGEGAFEIESTSASSSAAAVGAISDAENVTIQSGTLKVAGNVSGSAITFAASSSALETTGKSAVVAETALSGDRVELINSASDGSTIYESSVELTAGTLVLAADSGKDGGRFLGAFAGDLTKSGDGTWTVTGYSLGDSAETQTLSVQAGTLVWENASIGETASTISVSTGATLQIANFDSAAGNTLNGEIGGDGTLQFMNSGSADSKLTLNVDAAEGASWRLRLSGNSYVVSEKALPGDLLIEGTATGELALSEDAEMGGNNRVYVASGATLINSGATLTIGVRDSSQEKHTVGGTLKAADGSTIVQAGNISWGSKSEIVIGDESVFSVDVAAGVKTETNSATLTGTGTFEVLKTADDGSCYTLSGTLNGFTGTVEIGEAARVKVTREVFSGASGVTVDGEYVVAISSTSRDTARRRLTNVSGAGTIVIDAPNDNNILYAEHEYDTDNAFTGTVEVKSGVLSLDASVANDIAADVVVGGSSAAGYSENGSYVGILSGGFLKLVNDEGAEAFDVNDLDSEKFTFNENAGRIFSTGEFYADSDFGATPTQRSSASATGSLFATADGATLTLRNGAKADGSLFVAHGTTLSVKDSGSSVSGDFTLNGKLVLDVNEASLAEDALLGVGGNVTLNADNGAKAEIELDLTNFDGSLDSEKVVILSGTFTGDANALNSLVTVVDSTSAGTGTEWSISKDSAGNLVLRNAATEFTDVPSGLQDLYSAIKDSALGEWVQSDLGESTARLVALSPVSFGALVEMQSGFVSLENDLLRERLEQRRYERAFASDRGTQFKPFVNVFGSDRESDGDGTESSNYDITHYGAIGGFDVAVSPNTIFGVSLGLDWAKADLHDGAGKHEADSTRFGVYGMSVFGNAYFGWGLSAGGTSFDTKRHVAGETLTGSTNGNDVNASLLFGMGWTLSEAAGIDLAPYVGLDIGYAHTDSFTEEGGSETALDVDSLERWSLRGKIGATLSWRATESLRIGIDAAFAHEFLDSDLDVDAAFASGSLAGTAFSSKAYLMDENTIQIGPRIDFRLNDTWSVSAAYTFETDLDDTTAHSANVGFRARF